MGGAIDPGFHRNTDIHLHVDEGPAEGASAGVTMMSERRWRVTGRGRGLFAIEVDDGGGFRAATAAEVDAALRQRELFGAADYPGAAPVGLDDRARRLSMSVAGSRNLVGPRRQGFNSISRSKRLSTQVANLETRLIRWMVGTVIATATLTVGILRFIG